MTQSHGSQFTSSTIHSSQTYHSMSKKSDKLEKVMFGVLAGRSWVITCCPEAGWSTACCCCCCCYYVCGGNICVNVCVKGCGWCCGCCICCGCWYCCCCCATFGGWRAGSFLDSAASPNTRSIWWTCPCQWAQVQLTPTSSAPPFPPSSGCSRTTFSAVAPTPGPARPPFHPRVDFFKVFLYSFIVLLYSMGFCRNHSPVSISCSSVILIWRDSSSSSWWRLMY